MIKILTYIIPCCKYDKIYIDETQMADLSGSRLCDVISLEVGPSLHDLWKEPKNQTIGWPKPYE